MKNRFVYLLAGCCAAATMTAQAEDNRGYIGVNYVALEQETDYVPNEKLDIGELVIRFGGEINEYFSSELRVGTTVKSVEDDATGEVYSTNWSVGGLLRVRKELGAITPYVAIGYMWVNEDLSKAGPASDSRTLGNAAVAAGLDVSLGEKLGLNVEYFAYEVEPFGNDRRSGPSAGLFWRF